MNSPSHNRYPHPLRIIMPLLIIVGFLVPLTKSIIAAYAFGALFVASFIVWAMMA